jgi:hypothetical protein
MASRATAGRRPDEVNRETREPRERGLTPIIFPRTLPALEKQKNDYYLTKTILRSYGYGLTRKPRIFKPVKEPTERAQMGAAWRASFTGASRCLGSGRDESAPLLF